MASVSEDQLSNWTKPAFDNEDAKRENTEHLIRDAIKSHAFLKTIATDLSVYAKGSYKNNTNVRRDSDVDVAVEYTGVIFPEYGPDTNQDEVRRARGTSDYAGPLTATSGGFDSARFKAAVQEAMEQAFGTSAVTRRNKVITVRESSRSLAADVVPCATCRTYWSPTRYRQGIRLLPDKSPGHSIENYPEQHYQNGVSKNGRTNKRFKSVVRILKNLENKMVQDDNSPQVPSYLIECLVFNVPDDRFLASTWTERVRKILFHVWDDTTKDGYAKRWVEVNDIKYLFHSHQKRTLEQARAFANAAWQYVAET